jgi:pyridoxamine 5'-phosphate oxidase
MNENMYDAMRALPLYYDDLDASLSEAWRLLVRGAADRKSPIHTPAVATIGVDGLPKVRVVVLRADDPAARTLRFHTDRRGQKIAEFDARPHVQIVAYDPHQKIQLRVSGTAHVHAGDALATEAWMRSQPQSQLCYRQALAPGLETDDPAKAVEPAEHDGSENFRAVTIAIDQIEWLYLASSGHRRARFTWNQDRLDACWLAP